MIVRPLIPRCYSDNVRKNDLFKVFFDCDEGYIQLWAVDEVCSINDEVEIDLLAPGYIAFASDGGNEVYAFDSSGEIFMLPLIVLDPDVAIKVADSFPRRIKVSEVTGKVSLKSTSRGSA